MIEKKNIFDEINLDSFDGVYPELDPGLSMTNPEIFEVLIKNENLKLERIISSPNSTNENKWYDQVHDEWVILLKGSAALEFENNKIINLKPGDYILIPSHTKHKVKETDKSEPTIWLALHYK